MFLDCAMLLILVANSSRVHIKCRLKYKEDFSEVSSGSELFTGETNNQRAGTAGHFLQKISNRNFWKHLIRLSLSSGKRFDNPNLFLFKTSF